MNLTAIGKAYVTVTVAAAGVTATIFGKAMADITGLGKDISRISAKVVSKVSKKNDDDYFFDDEEGDDDGDDDSDDNEKGDVIAMMNAQNSAVTGDPVQ